MRNNDKTSFNKLRVEFLPEALEIVEKPASPLGNIIIWFVFFLLFAFVLWACIGKIDEVAVARGQIISDAGVQELQAAGTGIVTEVKVQEGQTVKKGDVLYSIDKEMEKLNIDYSEGEIGLTELKAELLEQLLLGKSIVDYRNGNYSEEQLQVIEDMITLNESDELSIAEYEESVESAESQYDLATDNLKNSESKEDYLNEQKDIQEQTHNLTSAGSIELEILQKDYNNAVAEEEKYKKLYEAGAKSKAEWQQKSNEVATLKKQMEIKQIELQNQSLANQGDASTMNYQLTEHEMEYATQQGTLDELKSNYEMSLLNLENAKSQRDSKLREMREQCQNQLKEYGVTVRQQYYEYENKDICAPYDGVVKTLKVGKEGAVVSSTQVVAEILPDSSQLIVEAELSNSDIGFVEVGQSVDIKIDTYDYQKYGMLRGTVIYISPDAMENDKMEQIYKVNVLLDADNANGLELSQGMECSVEIKTDRRRIIEFFLEPLTEALDSSLKER